MMNVDCEYSETRSTTTIFEWRLRDVKNLFESSDGASKSKAIRSANFGEGWRILFYASGGTEGECMGLFLSSEPTLEEKETAPHGKWVRDGVFNFSFELRKPDCEKSILHNAREASNHIFSYKTTNWGWNQFARRDKVYFSSDAVKNADCLIIICTITSVPSVPTPQAPSCLVPKALLDTIGGLLDDPVYSDVEFILPRHRPGTGSRKLLAARKMLERADYFQTMFSSGFAEVTSRENVATASHSSKTEMNDGESMLLADDFDDSDDSDDEMVDTEEESAVFLPGETSNTDLDAQGREVNSRSSCSPYPTANNGEAKLTANQKRFTVVIRDIAFSTYHAVLYYIYTDTIVFAPLSSSFIPSISQPSDTSSESSSQPEDSAIHKKSTVLRTPRRSRKTWIREWQKTNPGRPAPCSAKSAYRLADRLDLLKLKEAAFQFIAKSLTADNIVHEIFSPFSAAFDDISKVQIKFFLDNWATIRSSDAMQNVWQQIRTGRHPGFEKVWPIILSSLQVAPSTVGADDT